MSESGSGGNMQGGITHAANNEKLCYTVPEVAKLLGVSRNFGYELARTGQLPILRFGKRMLVPKAQFQRMLGEYPESERS